MSRQRAACEVYFRTSSTKRVVDSFLVYCIVAPFLIAGLPDCQLPEICGREAWGHSEHLPSHDPRIASRLVMMSHTYIANPSEALLDCQHLMSGRNSPHMLPYSTGFQLSQLCLPARALGQYTRSSLLASQRSPWLVASLTRNPKSSSPPQQLCVERSSFT